MKKQMITWAPAPVAEPVPIAAASTSLQTHSKPLPPSALKAYKLSQERLKPEESPSPCFPFVDFVLELFDPVPTYVEALKEADNNFELTPESYAYISTRINNLLSGKL